MVTGTSHDPRPRSSAPASLPPAGLPGLDPAWSRLVEVADAAGLTRAFHVLDSGSGAGDSGTACVGTLLCVHGNPTWSYLWRSLVADPPEGWRVVAVDQLGMGWSERIDTVRRLGERIDDLGRLVEALGIIGPVVTVAHDWGGPVSLGWALGHRDQLAGVVLTNTAVHQPAGSPVPRLIRLARTPTLLQAICERTPTFVRATTALSQPALSARVRDAFAAPYRGAARRRAVADFVSDIPLEDDHPSMPALTAVAEGVRGLDVPVFLAWGPGDPVFSDRYLRDLIDRIPHADVHRYEGASHLVTEDAPRLFDDIRRWVSALGSPAPQREATSGAPGVRRPLGYALEQLGSTGATASRVAVRELAGAGRTITWGQLARVVDDLAAGLLDAGVAPGDRVALLVPPGADLTAALYACWRIGAVIVVADAGLGIRGLARALRGSWPQHVIGIERGLLLARLLRVGGRRFAAGPITRRRARLLGAESTLADLAARGHGRALPPHPEPDAVAAVLFTSGATGPAKGVVYRHGQIEANRDALIELYGVTSSDRLVAAFAPFALYGPAMGVASAVPDVDVTKPATLDAVRLAAAVAAVQATLVWASPAALRHVAATRSTLTPLARQDLSSVRLLMSAGAPVPADILHQVLDLMPAAEAHTPYGMTEVLPVTDISLAELDELSADQGPGVPGNGVCVGHAIAGVRLRVSALDPSGSATGIASDTPGVTGEILVSAPWRKDNYDRLWATESRASDDTGWHRTGDVGHLDEDGRLWVEGRLPHVITTAAGPVTPVGVEQRVSTVTGVEAAACVGVGPVGAQVVVIVVVLRGVASRRSRLARTPVLADDAMTAAVRAVAGVPVAAVLVSDALPVDVRHNSKIDRSALAVWATGRLS